MSSPFLDEDIIWNNVWLIVKMLMGITSIHFTLALLLRTVKLRKLPFQITTFIVNFTFSVMGIYFWILNAYGRTDVTDEDKISGFVSMSAFGSAQIAFQLWSIPVGLSFGERVIMLLHHVAALCTASVITFYEQGYRFHIVYFYGVMELSSLPLSVMNTFKDNRILIEQYPSYYKLSRHLFAFLFVLVRILILLPIWFEYISLLWNTNVNSDGLALLGFRVLFYPSLFLMLLQFYWAFLIVKALLPKKRKES